MYICNIKQWKFTKKNNSLYSYTDVVRLYVQSPNFHICTFCKHIRTVKNDPSRQKKIEKIVKLDNVLKHTIWVTSSRQTLQSMKTNKVRLKYAVKLGKFGLSVHIFLITMNEEK